MMITLLPITRRGENGESEVGFRVINGDREIEVFGNSKSATIDGVRAIVAAEIIRDNRGRDNRGRDNRGRNERGRNERGRNERGRNERAKKQ